MPQTQEGRRRRAGIPGEETWATPALDGGRIYVRTQQAVYCFAGAK
jgi:hypothetical protein